MKLKNIFKLATIAVASGTTLMGVTSCNYLDVVPPEQAGLPDAMKNHTNALGFLYSCYADLEAYTDLAPRAYLSTFNASTDEYALPEAWYAGDATQAYNVMRNTSSANAQTWIWGRTYKGIGQCLLFEQQLEGEGRKNGVWNTEEEYNEWLAETRFLKAYYHFATLRLYGPIPLTTELISMDAADSEFPGRTHFDGCVDYIVNELDEAAKDLPDTRPSEEIGRATSVICKAIKARLLLYAASDLWNGSGKFPYPQWKNTSFTSKNPVTGEDYGYELVAKNTTSEQQIERWKRAYTACDEALQAAKEAGHELFQGYELTSDSDVKYADIYVPGKENNTEEDLEFKQNVQKMRYAVSTTYDEGNHEIIWGLMWQPYGWDTARLPRRCVQNASTKAWLEGWNGVAPTLYTVTHFLNEDGTLPDEDDANLYNTAGLASPRNEVINLCVGREPRFYAWIGFNGGDMLTVLYNGKPMTLNMRDGEKQGRGAGERNYSATGFLGIKFLDPKSKWTTDGSWVSGKNSPEVLIRMAELYLDLAECAAELSNRGVASMTGVSSEGNGNTAEVAKNCVNIIRDRAGATELTNAMISGNASAANDADGTTEMSLLDWVRNERFIEFWNEGQRYYDVRRWVMGDTYFGTGKRKGLNGLQVGASLTEFNTPTVLNKTYTFHRRQYLYPVFLNEVYKNPQMVQAPGY
jgi:hypothetical protein